METAEVVEAAVQKALAPLVERIDQLAKRPPQEYFSVRQAAAYTGLSSAHVRRAVTGGTLPCSNVGTSVRLTYRISRDDIKQWMDRRKEGALPPARRRKAAAVIPLSRHHAPQRAA